MRKNGGRTVSRKAEHVAITLNKDVQYSKGTGFSDIDFEHHALPELDFEKIDSRTRLFNRKMSAPLIISSMTGGYPGAEKINLQLAEAAAEAGVAMGVGSQRAMIEKKEMGRTYAIRKAAPDMPLFGNIGIYQLKRYSVEQVEGMVQGIEADALAVHINPLQEILQPEGDRDFSGCLHALQKLCERLSVPVIAKEVGAGISGEVAKMLVENGVKYVDVSGSGGTSWSAVEIERIKSHHEYWDWGI
ncbi:MAG: type 2 isopentenyl-diphosphate Delta-isomerase, partial [Candidatus Micrarchaeia archaeon]